LASIDSKKRAAIDIENFDLKASPVEKNWSPFLFEGKDGQEKLYFEYMLANPRTIYDTEKSLLIEAIDEPELPWDLKWGKPLGGTPARLVDGQYLSFFHSKFKDKYGIVWYVFGAYTFEAQPPFRITAMSARPITYEGIYDSEYLNTAEPCKCVIFPGSFAISDEGGSTRLHLACGENDSSIKVITFDKDELLQTLVPIDLD
jgi:hypothetical protein